MASLAWYIMLALVTAGTVHCGGEESLEETDRQVGPGAGGIGGIGGPGGIGGITGGDLLSIISQLLAGNLSLKPGAGTGNAVAGAGVAGSLALLAASVKAPIVALFQIAAEITVMVALILFISYIASLLGVHDYVDYDDGSVGGLGYSYGLGQDYGTGFVGGYDAGYKHLGGGYKGFHKKKGEVSAEETGRGAKNPSIINSLTSRVYQALDSVDFGDVKKFMEDLDTRFS